HVCPVPGSMSQETCKRPVVALWREDWGRTVTGPLPVTALHRPIHGNASTLCRTLSGERFAHGGPLAHALPVRGDFRQAGRVDAIAFQPLRDGEEIGVADRVTLAHHPGAGQHG